MLVWVNFTCYTSFIRQRIEGYGFELIIHEYVLVIVVYLVMRNKIE